jgi:hypothetical protein
MGNLTITRSAAVFVSVAIFLTANCRQNTVNTRLDNEMPQKIVWAWERPEDLRFLDPAKYGVAFLAQTIFLENERVIPRPRRQPMELAPGTYLIAVTRIETNKDEKKRPTFDDAMIERSVSLIKTTLSLPDVKAVQIDFDAVASERRSYRSLMNALRSQLPPGIPLTMTSLASWCTGDAWFNDFPVDEAVPMVFRMGADDEKIRTFLRNGNDWNEPLCRGSYGIAIEEPLDATLKPNRRLYYFRAEPWKPTDLSLIK